MKKYTFELNTNKNSYANSKSTDYSKILDDLIHADIMEKNYYLNNSKWNTTGDIYLDKMIGINENNSSIGLKDADALDRSRFVGNGCDKSFLRLGVYDTPIGQNIIEHKRTNLMKEHLHPIKKKLFFQLNNFVKNVEML